MPQAKDTVKSSSRKSVLPLTGQPKTKATDNPIAKNNTAPKAASKKPAVATATTVPTATTDSRKKMAINPEERYRMVAVAAYYRAEKRGFVGGDPAQDWVDAEAEVTQLIGK